MMNSNDEPTLKNATSRVAGRVAFVTGKIPAIIVGIVLVLLIKSAVVLFVWNAVIPDLFDAPRLNYEQAVGLTLLAMLWVGFPRFGRFARRSEGAPWKTRWAGFSPEEREKLRAEFRRRVWGEPSE